MSFVVVDSSHQGRTLYEVDLFYCLRLEGEEAINRLRECLRRGDDVTCKYKGWTFLGSLCCMGKLQMLKVVIEHLKEVFTIKLGHSAHCIPVNSSIVTC